MASGASGRLDDLVRSLAAGEAPSLPPIERWNPPDCGEIDIRIDREGVWHHEGRPIHRPALVKLFASVLRHGGEAGGRYELVTPAEKLGIRVEDAPLLAVEMQAAPSPAGEVLVFRTNLDDVVTCDADHPLRFDEQPGGAGPRPYIYVRRGLWARLTRPIYLDLAERAQTRTVDGREMIGVASGSSFFAMMPADALEDEAPAQTGEGTR
ncbi:DUF1285 domain-containing protein [Ancylobacter sp. MQZ15Z-1]|uniref:DUF1285 domain-containing protein n=1 Tax=Ancylobacter mangrovi TaxID=2972472 RepID=A0A9X2PAM3_9HYPH|nr:DUF1285 domain-containing protein [Ancylobacter mangrovi]MCS0493849.1 DUF1285 domain-containing protein [Ancylobacter mangrovi]